MKNLYLDKANIYYLNAPNTNEDQLTVALVIVGEGRDVLKNDSGQPLSFSGVAYDADARKYKVSCSFATIGTRPLLNTCP